MPIDYRQSSSAPANRQAALRSIQLLDSHQFAILWNDGVKKVYRLSDLQRMCPCALCFDPVKNIRLPNANEVDDQVTAGSIKSVGRYAIKIQFSSGCTNGIFSFEMLYGLGEELP